MTTEPKLRGSAAAIGLILLAALSLVAWLGSDPTAQRAEANHPTVTMAVDVDVSGNSALALGARQACRVINVGQVINVDITVTGISDIASWEAYIKYDRSKLLITKPGDNSQNNNHLFLLQQAQTSNNLFNTSDSLPDSDTPGIYTVGAADLAVIPGFQDPYPGTNPPQHADGVLLRLEVQGATSGFSSLRITPFQAGPGTVGPFIKDSFGNLVADGGDADPFVDNVLDGGIIVGSGSCTDTDGDSVPDNIDNCPTVPNVDQANFDAQYGDTQGDACDTDDDNDGLLDTLEPEWCYAPLPAHPGRLDPDCDDDLISDGPNDPDSGNPILAGPDNCISVANGPGQAGIPGVGNQTNTDGDSMGDACDPDDDNDGVLDGSDNCQFVANASQANYDAGWGDTQGGDACDPEADGDGYSNVAEAHVGTLTLDHCGNLVTIPGHTFTTSSAWPADLRSGPESFSLHKINVQDLGAFITPIRHINTSPNDAGYNIRWDLAPGTTFGKHINVADIATITSGGTGHPLMFGGARAYGGPACSPP
jgi:hypothetical protein